MKKAAYGRKIHIEFMSGCRECLYARLQHRPTTFGGESLPIAVFSGREGTGLTEFSFTGESAAFVRPHVIRVCPHGEHVFVSDIGSFDAKANESLLWKFKVDFTISHMKIAYFLALMFFFGKIIFHYN